MSNVDRVREKYRGGVVFGAVCDAGRLPRPRVSALIDELLDAAKKDFRTGRMGAEWARESEREES